MTEARHALISGGSSGIGLALAERLVDQGWNLSLIARGNERLERARQHLLQRCNGTRQVFIHSADLSDGAAAAGAAQAAINNLGVPELVITSAGLARPGHFEEIPLEVFEQTMAVNYFGTVYLLKTLVPAMRQRGRGHIALISSGAALIGVYGYSAYGPSKFAVRGLAETLRGELRPHGIGVSVVYPPDTDTPQLEAENRTKPAETFLISGNAKTWQPGDVADVVLKGIRKGRFAITPGLEMGLLSPLHSLIGPLLQRYFDHLVRKARRN